MSVFSAESLVLIISMILSNISVYFFYSHFSKNFSAVTIDVGRSLWKVWQNVKVTKSIWKQKHRMADFPFCWKNVRKWQLSWEIDIRFFMTEILAKFCLLFQGHISRNGYQIYEELFSWRDKCITLSLTYLCCYKRAISTS